LDKNSVKGSVLAAVFIKYGYFGRLAGLVTVITIAAAMACLQARKS
jgi:hypothetical protein